MIIPPSSLRSPICTRLVDVSLLQSSSPLSSPPPVLFDSSTPSSPSVAVSSRRNSTAASEAGISTPTPNPLGSSQTSNSSRSSLPNIKGKDLFDATIWSDPLRTSVFYTFATSLRQRIKTAEPSSSHRFISHLRDRGKLVRCYTQNIDQIEEKVGLSTCLLDGPGNRGRFSRRCTATANQLNKMVDEAATVADGPIESEKQSPSEDQRSCNPSQPPQTDSSDGTSMPGSGGENVSSDQRKPAVGPPKRDLPRSGVECVFLHGSLELLRCFLCGRVCSWDDDEREAETLTGQQPECPHCVGATAAREERGKRALGVGKLRPDIVLYGEEHPSSHLISPIVTHDLALHPDMLLILGTSLRVHGLKVMVREFAKAVHSKGGKVVFVNFTKPPESSWGDIIDYWVQWDCDAWVADLQGRIPKLWQDHDSKGRESGETVEGRQKEEKRRQPAANPVALRDTRATGAYWTAKILQELARITEKGQPARKASMRASQMTSHSMSEHATSPLRKKGKAKARPSRKSAPGALEKSTRPASALNPGHDGFEGTAWEAGQAAPETTGHKAAMGSILTSVKENPRIRKRRVIDGEEVAAPCAPQRRARTQGCKTAAADLRLPPLRSPPAQHSRLPCIFGRPEPLEPRSPPSGPLTSLSPNLRIAKPLGAGPFHLDISTACLLDPASRWSPPRGEGQDGGGPMLRSGSKGAEPSQASGLKKPEVGGSARTGPRPLLGGNLEGKLMDWGANWSCKR